MYSIISLSKLINELSKLPTIGPKTAQRLAFYLIGASSDYVQRLVEAILEVKDKIKTCSICGNFTEDEVCTICKDTNRDQTVICVIEQSSNVFAFERIGGYQGVYHILGGVISPLDGIGPQDLRIKELLTRIQSSTINEIIVATNPNIEGETTSLYLSKLIKPLNIYITRLAYGLPVGGELEYTDEVTLARAFEGRREI